MWLQRALRAHWARRHIVRRCRVSSSASVASDDAEQSADANAFESLEHIHASAPRSGDGIKARMSIRHVCAVQIQGVARGMLVRVRLRRWHRARAQAHAAISERVARMQPSQRVASSSTIGSACESFPRWIVRPPRACSVKGDAVLGGVWDVVEELRAELEAERVARRKQDEALRVLWSEVCLSVCLSASTTLSPSLRVPL